MTKTSKAVSKYLRYYSTLRPEGTALNQGLLPENEKTPASYGQALVIPAFNETPDFLTRLAQLDSDRPTLIVVVINCPAYADSESAGQTRNLIHYIQTNLTIENVSEGVTFGQLNSRLDLLSLDTTQERPDWLKPLQSGVGFARKVGMDVALNLWQQGKLENPWVLSSDADACWPADYLSCTRRYANEKGAMTLNYRHQHSCDDERLSPAAALYELSLRYYVLGLRWAGSPWAYHTVGSVLAIHCESYSEVRGFPVREAGEDFYLLNKIAKTATIHCPDEPVLRLSDRSSDRVPFGTGPAVKRIGEQLKPQEDFLLYNPETFRLLKRWHQCIEDMATNGFDSARLSLLPSDLLQGLQSLGLDKALSHCRRQAKTGERFAFHLWQWFDGFRTLKLIHWFRAHGYPSVSYESWCNALPKSRIEWIPGDVDEGFDPVSVNRHLITTENNTLPFQGGLQK